MDSPDYVTMVTFVVKQIFASFFSFHLLFSLLLICEPAKSETVKDYCPDEGKAHHGEWRLDEKDGYRCILKCHHGYSPSGCHVLRKDGYGEWNYNKTTCEEEHWLLNKKTACITAIGTTILASPALLSAVGFSAPGIVAGSLASKYMAYVGSISKGSWFAYLQSLGMKGGISKGVLTPLMSGVGTACDGLTSFFSGTACEEE